MVHFSNRHFLRYRLRPIPSAIAAGRFQIPLLSVKNVKPRLLVIGGQFLGRPKNCGFFFGSSYEPINKWRLILYSSYMFILEKTVHVHSRSYWVHVRFIHCGPPRFMYTFPLTSSLTVISIINIHKP